MNYSRYVTIFLGFLLIFFHFQAFAVGDPTLGKAVFEDATGKGCAGSSCHGTSPATNTNKIQNGTTSATVINAFSSVGNMAALKTLYTIKYITDVDVGNVVAYINSFVGPSAPARTVTPAGGLVFGSVTQGVTSAPLTATLKNTGAATLNITSITVTGTNAADFTKGTTTCGATLAAAAFCTVNVTFTPSASGARSAALRFTDNAAGSPFAFALTGTGAAVAVPGISLTPTSLAYGNQQINTTSTAQTVTLKNTGTGTMTIGSITSSSTDFLPTKTCGASLGAGLTCTISVTFKPAALGTKTGSISISDNASGSPHAVTLSGTGVAAAAPAITLTPNTGLAFGNQTVGIASAAQTVTLKNSGTANLTIATITVGGTNAAEFNKSGTCSNGGTVIPNGTCTIIVSFTPSAIGARSGSVAITSNAAAANISLSGIAVTAPTAQVSLTPTSLAFGNQTINSSSVAKTVTLTNSGNAALSITSIAALGEFTQSNNCGASLAAGLSCTISVTFTPTTVANKTGSVTITNNATGSPHHIALTGAGVAAAAPAVGPLPVSLSFGNQVISSASAAQSVTLSNIGSASLSITTIATTGDFAKSGGTCANGGSVAAGSSCTILVTFSPKVLGALSGTLTITDNAAISPRSISLAGTGVATAGPTATLMPAKLTFAHQTINTTSAVQLATLKNISASAVLNISSITISGANSGDFAKTATCGATLAAGASCTISVTFKPTAAAVRMASLSVASNATGALSTALEGTGIAVAAPVASLSASSLAFGNQTVSVTSATKSFTLSNTGNGLLNITSIVASGDFAQTNTCGTQVAAGANCVISVTFTPTTAGARTGKVALTTDAASSPDDVSLTGAGVLVTTPQLTITPASLTFADQTVGSQSTAQVATLKNTGNGVMQLKSIVLGGSHAADFSLTETCGATLAPSAMCTVSVVFKPTTAGSPSASVNIASDAGDGSDSIPITGKGISVSAGTPILSIPTVALNFETTKAGLVSAELEITLKNVGTADLKLGKINIQKGDHFTLTTNTCTATLAPAMSCTIRVKFMPKTSGEHVDNLEVSNDSDGITELVELKGQAAAADTGGGTPTTASGGGGGCAINPNVGFDSSLPLLLLAVFSLAMRRRKL